MLGFVNSAFVTIFQSDFGDLVRTQELCLYLPLDNNVSPDIVCMHCMLDTTYPINIYYLQSKDRNLYLLNLLENVTIKTKAISLVSFHGSGVM